MLAPFIGGRADEKLITAHWNDALRFATSVSTGAASASLLLKRLGAYPRQNGLALTLREIGRIERTLFILDWIELAGLRRQTTAELNKGEARNALVRAVCLHRLGRLRDRAIEAQQYGASALARVTAAIALWNIVYLGRAIDALRHGGEMIPDALLAHLAPVGWHHINLTGDYLWDSDIGLGPRRVPTAALGSKKPATGCYRLSVFPMWSCLPCYPARFMASPLLERDTALQTHPVLHPAAAFLEDIVASEHDPFLRGHRPRSAARCGPGPGEWMMSKV